ncbi:NAD-dependent epimerase/dehydratase family protein [Solimonas soli]|uniref:NAD-dependent epimerase/dehydratase family protein n=1 Tax=Solimonas soli TaxID=413479 RepID=UPI0004B8910D|nr:NAD-dependent epimerase/dehydratase family protein [Solimonas soli]
MTSRVLVLGGAGYIGGHVLRALCAGGFEQPLLGTRRARAAPAGVQLCRVDALDRAALRAALDGVDAVVNCVAGAPRMLQRQAALLADAVRAHTPQPLVVQLSSMAVYGDREGRVDEGAAPGRLSAYGAAKREAERELARCERSVMLRAGCVYGPDSEQWTLRIARLLREGRLGDLGAAGDGRCNLVHVDDVAAAVLHVLRRAPRGVAFNLAAPQAPSWNEYLVRFACLLDATPVRRITPRRLAAEAYLRAPLLKVLRRAGAGRAAATTITPSLLALFRQDIVLDSQAAERELRQRWVPLDQGLAACAAALRGGVDKPGLLSA